MNANIERTVQGAKEILEPLARLRRLLEWSDSPFYGSVGDLWACLHLYVEAHADPERAPFDAVLDVDEWHVLREIGARSIACACGRMLTKPAEVTNEKLAVAQRTGRIQVFGGARMADLPGRLCRECFDLSGP